MNPAIISLLINATTTPAIEPWALQSKGRLLTSKKPLLTPLPGPVLLGESQPAGSLVALRWEWDPHCWRARSGRQGQGCGQQAAQLATNPFSLPKIQLKYQRVGKG